MPCPSCGGTDIVFRGYHGIPVLRCAGCRGFAVDASQLDDLIQVYLERHPDLSPGVLRLARPESLVERHLRTCPACGCQMRVTNYAYDSNIFIDRCHACGRIWLDREELQALARHWKGHPKLNRLGDSVAEAMVDRENTREMLANLPNVPWVLLASPVPIGDNLVTTRLPIVNLSIMIVCFLVPMMAWLLEVPIERLWQIWGRVPARIVSGEAWLTTVTSMFLHSGFVHLFGNMFALAVFGDDVECRLGHVRYLLFYLLCGVAGGLAHIAFYPTSTVPSIGASGAIAGVLGAYVVLYPQASIHTIYGVSVPAFLYIGIWVASQVFAVLLIVNYGAHASIGYFSHVGGLAVGVLVAMSMRAWESWAAPRSGPAAR